MILFSILFLSCIIFLYILFLFTKEDFILLRKNITLENVFNIAVITFIVSALCARLIYVIGHFSYIYINPLVFLGFFYFPGVSFIGAILGILLVFFFLKRNKKLVVGHLFDLFMLAVISSLPLIFTFTFIASLFHNAKQWILLGEAGICGIFAGVSVWLFGKVTKDGTVGFLITSIISFMYLFVYFPYKIPLKGISIDFILAAIVGMFGLLLCIKQELYYLRKKKK